MPPIRLPYDGEPIVCDEELLERVGNDRVLLSRMIELFAADSAQQLERARTAVQARDHGTLQRCAHALRGSVGNFSAAAAIQTAMAIEVAARAAEWNGISLQLDALETQIRQIIEHVQRLTGPTVSPGNRS